VRKAAAEVSADSGAPNVANEDRLEARPRTSLRTPKSSTAGQAAQPRHHVAVDAERHAKQVDCFGHAGWIRFGFDQRQRLAMELKPFPRPSVVD
jgi:hypothetical protein